MNWIKEKPYLIFFISFPILVLLALFTNHNTLEVNVHDTYFVIDYIIILGIIIIFYSGLGILYYIFEKKKWMYTPKEGEQFFFMHIPKTGGTTFRKMLTNHFPEGSYYPTQEDLLANGGGYFTKEQMVLNKIELKELNLIVGHYNVDFALTQFPKFKKICFLKNPYTRVISHLNHIINQCEKYNSIDPNIVLEKELNNIVSVQSKMFGYNRKVKDYKIVRENIERVDFIGITEEWTKSITLFNKKFGFKLVEIPRQNKTSFGHSELLSDKSKAKIISRIVPEIHTYNIAKKKFIKDLKNEGL